MSPLQELMAEVPQTGRVRWIGVRPQSRADLVILDAVEARREAGLTGDHARSGARNVRQVTLIQWEHLAVINALLGRPTENPVLPQDLRRNIVVSGINLFSLKGRLIDNHDRLPGLFLDQSLHRDEEPDQRQRINIAT